MASRKDYFRFLDLPGELRNRIYEVSASHSVYEQCCILPGHALAQTCRQLRTEYLPICRRAPMTINWRNVPHYLYAFYPSIAGQVQNIDQAPASMTIIVDRYRKNGKSTTIDLLVLIKIRLAHTSFVCHFVRSGDELVAETEEREKITLESDGNMLQALMHHDDEQWLNHISTGKVFRVSVTPIGTYPEPDLRIYVFHDGYTQSLADAGYYKLEAEDLSYLEEVDLLNAWYGKNNHDKVWPQIYRLKAMG